MTRGVADWINENDTTAGFRSLMVQQCLARHSLGDWGLVCAEDKLLNDAGLDGSDRLMSVWVVDSTSLWIITEWDRSVTTVLFPSEY
ncbi:MAG: hypothetical protein WC322_06700 [Candidatus Paceibacterota bacterium]|jgi:hypothetical protein